MTARCYVLGTIAPRSQPAAMLVRGAVVEPTRTPIVAQVSPLGTAIADLLASGVEPCPVCNRYACDCDEWHEIMFTDPIDDKPCPRCRRYNCNCAAQPFDPDPHGDLSWRESFGINY